MIVCSDDNVLATAIIKAESATKILLVNTNYSATSPKRELELTLEQFPYGEMVHLAWSRALYLVAWTASGHLAIIDIKNKRVRVKRVNGGFLKVVWIPVGILGALPGCHTFLCLQPNGTLLIFKQITTGGAFLCDRVIISCSFSPEKVHFLFPLEASFFIFLSTPTELCVKEIEMSITLGMTIDRTQHNLPPFEVACVSWDSKQKKILLIGGVGSEMLKIRLGSVGQEFEEFQVPVNHLIENIICGNTRSLLHLITAQRGSPECILVSLATRQVVKTVLMEPSVIHPTTLVKPGVIPLKKFCLSANCAYIFLLFTEGCIFECRLKDPLNEKCAFEIPEAVSLNRNFSDTLRALAACPITEQSTIYPFLDELISKLPVSIRKAHLAGDIASVLAAWPQMADYYLLFVFLWRLNHFWEVAICSTEDLGRTLQALESSPEAPIGYQFESLPLLTELAIEVVDGLAELFSSLTQEIRNRALLVSTVNHRINAVIILIKTIRDVLMALVRKYEQKGMATLLNYFKSYLMRLDSSLQAIDLKNIASFLKHIKPEANQSISFIFSNEVPTFTAPVPQILASHQHDSLLDRHRDAISGRWISPDLLTDYCPRCFAPIESIGSSLEEVPQLPFWHAHWRYSCPCGSPL